MYIKRGFGVLGFWGFGVFVLPGGHVLVAFLLLWLSGLGVLLGSRGELGDGGLERNDLRLLGRRLAPRIGLQERLVLRLCVGHELGDSHVGAFVVCVVLVLDVAVEFRIGRGLVGPKQVEKKVGRCLSVGSEVVAAVLDVSVESRDVALGHVNHVFVQFHQGLADVA